MIIDYEKAFWESFHIQFPEFTALNYAKDESLFEVYQQVKSLPSMYFNRSDDNWTWRKLHKIYHTDRRTVAMPIDVDYNAALLVEKQKDASAFAKRVLDYFETCPYVYLNQSEDDEDCTVKVSQRSQYIKIEEVRNSKEKEGALRLVRFSWKVSLLLTKDTLFSYSMIKQINVIINNQETQIKYSYT